MLERCFGSFATEPAGPTCHLTFALIPESRHFSCPPSTIPMKPLQPVID